MSHVQPMEARSVSDIPRGSEWQYEPKWDGFRCLLARKGNTVTLTSKSGQSLTRYFPEVAQAAAELPERRFTLDGELVVESDGRLSFDALLQRIHPAASPRQCTMVQLHQKAASVEAVLRVVQRGSRKARSNSLKTAATSA